MKILAGVLAGVFLFYIPPALFLSDLPQAGAIILNLGIGRWDWGGLSALAVHLLALLFALGGAGAVVLAFLPRVVLCLGDLLVFCLALGTAATGTVVLGLGLAGLLGKGVFLLLYAIGGGCAFFSARGLRQRWAVSRGGGSGKPRRMGGEEKFALALMGAGALWVLLFALADMLAPEAFWDALVYHLGVPKRYLEMHKIALVRPFFSNMPLLMSMDYMFALAVKGESLARALNSALGCALIYAVYRLGRAWLSRPAALLAAAVALTTPLLGLVMLHAGADTATALFSCLALLCFMRAFPSAPRGEPRRAWLLTAGVFAGASAAVKLPGAAVIFLLALFMIRSFRHWHLLLVPSVLVFLPWGLKSWLLAGNPVMPFLGGVFPSPFWDEFARESYSRELVQIWNQLSFADFLNWGAVSHLQSRFKLGLVGPVVFLASVAVLAGRREKKAFLPLLFCAGLGAVWVMSVPAYRFYIAGFAVLPALFAGGAGGLMKWAAPAVVLVHMAWFPLVLNYVDAPWTAARRDISREDFYRGIHANPSMDASDFLEYFMETGPRARVLSTGEVRTFLTAPFTISPSYFEMAPLVKMAREAADPRRLRIRVKQLGVRYLLVNVTETMRLYLWENHLWEGRAPGVLAGFFARHAKLIYARSSGWVYLVHDGGDSAAFPECFRVVKDAPAYSVASCSARIQDAIMTGEAGKAIGLGWAAVAAGPHSGLAWASLGDALFNEKRFEDSIAAYRRALTFGWRTSSVYRNMGIALAMGGRYAQARASLQYALVLDPAARQIRRDIEAVREKWTQSLRKMGAKI